MHLRSFGARIMTRHVMNITKLIERASMVMVDALTGEMIQNYIISIKFRVYIFQDLLFSVRAGDQVLPAQTIAVPN